MKSSLVSRKSPHPAFGHLLPRCAREKGNEPVEREGLISRRGFLSLAIFASLGIPARAATHLTFDELYAAQGVLGLKFTEKVKSLAGSIVTMRGFMAPPLKAEAKFFVLTEIPMALCPFCSSDAD